MTVTGFPGRVSEFQENTVVVVVECVQLPRLDSCLRD